MVLRIVTSGSFDIEREKTACDALAAAVVGYVNIASEAKVKGLLE